MAVLVIPNLTASLGRSVVRPQILADRRGSLEISRIAASHRCAASRASTSWSRHGISIPYRNVSNLTARCPQLVSRSLGVGIQSMQRMRLDKHISGTAVVHHIGKSRSALLIGSARVSTTGQALKRRNKVLMNARASTSSSADRNGQVQTLPVKQPTDVLRTGPNPATNHHENIYNIPNFLTLTRLIATPAIGYLIMHNQHLYAFTLFTYAAVSDLLDGWIARRWHLQTVVGSVVDPMADKLLMTTLVTCLAVNGSLSLPLFALILGRDVSLAISALYYRYASLPAPKTMARYWDFSLPSAEVHPTTISKFNTFLQLTLLGTLLCTNLLHDPSATSSAAGGVLLSLQDGLGGEGGVKHIIQTASAIVASTTVYSGLEYTWSKKAVVILGNDEGLKKKQGLRGRTIMASGFGSFIALAVYLWATQPEREDQQSDDEETGHG